jgi:hypothetical protein
MPNTVDGGPLASDAVVLTVKMETIATAKSVFVPCPTKGRITRLQSIISAAITTADEAITFEVNGTAQSELAITITQSGSAIGDVDTAEANLGVPVEVGDQLEIISAGSSGGTSDATFVITIEPTGV